jgi:hypothetical protein
VVGGLRGVARARATTDAECWREETEKEIFLMLFIDVASSCSHVSCEFVIVNPICV